LRFTRKVITKALKHSLRDESLAFVTQGLNHELSQTETCVCVSEGILIVYIDAGEGCPESQYDMKEKA